MEGRCLSRCEAGGGGSLRPSRLEGEAPRRLPLKLEGEGLRKTIDRRVLREVRTDRERVSRQALRGGAQSEA